MPSGKPSADLRIPSVVYDGEERIFGYLPHSLFMLDPKGNVLLSNSTPPATLGITVD